MSKYNEEEEYVNPNTYNTKGWKRVTKVFLYHIDGTKDEMRLTFPVWEWGSDLHQFSQYRLSQLVFMATNHYIKITHCEIFAGTIDENGEEHYSFSQVYEVTKNKFYKRDKWINSAKPLHPAKLGFRYEKERIVTFEDGTKLHIEGRWVKDLADLAELEKLYPSDVIPNFKRIVKTDYLE